MLSERSTTELHARVYSGGKGGQRGPQPTNRRLIPPDVTTRLFTSDKRQKLDELGIDPRTSRMLSERSTTELHALVNTTPLYSDIMRFPQHTVDF